MQKNNSLTQCTINIVNDTTPVFVINNLGINTTTSSVCTEVMNTITLPSIQFSFSNEGLNIFKNKDVFFIQEQCTHELEAVVQEVQTLVNQLRTTCSSVKVINLSDFVSFNNYELNKRHINLNSVKQASNLDDVAFHHLLIYFCNLDENDLEFTFETYCQDEEFDIAEINAMISSYQEMIYEK